MLILAGFCLPALAGANALAKAPPLKLNNKEAQRLAALAQPGTNKSNLNDVMTYLDYNKDANVAGEPPFFEFEGLSDTSNYEFFAVNPWTGDVWALWGCKRMMTRGLHKAQVEIRHRFTPEERAQYPKLHRLRPVCISGD